MSATQALAEAPDVAVHHVTRAGDYALVRSQWRITGTGHDGKSIEVHHHGMEVMRRHPYGADPSWAVSAGRIPPSAHAGRYIHDRPERKEER